MNKKKRALRGKFIALNTLTYLKKERNKLSTKWKSKKKNRLTETKQKELVKLKAKIMELKNEKQ